MAEERPVWPTMVWLGLLCGVALGAVLVLLFRRQSQSQQQLGDAGGGIHIYNGGYPQQQPVFDIPYQQPQLAAPVNHRRKTAARTSTVGPTVQTTILRATGSRDWSVTVRTVGPPGSFASFATGNNPAEVINVPAGQYQQMYLQNGDYLYASGDMPNTEVSVSGGEVV